MKIACVGTDWYPERPGGLEKYVFGMTRAFLDAGDSIDLFVYGNPAITHPNARAFSLGSQSDPIIKRFGQARSTFATSLRGPHDVINMHFALNALPLIPFIKHDTPRVIHFHGPWAEESRAEGGGRIAIAMKRRLERFVYARADRFVVLSTAFKTLLTAYGVDPARISVIPMGIDSDLFKPASDRRAVRSELGWPSEKTVFFTARRLVNRVGLAELIRAARIIRDQRDDFVIKIAGKGPLLEELQTAIRASKLEDCVELLGFVSEDNLVRSYQSADLTVLPTQSLEGFGTIISESLACGTPVIVTPIGGMPEAIEALSPDAVAKSPSSSDIAALMLAVLQGDIKLPDAERCRYYATKNFDWKVVVRQIRSVFEMSICDLDRRSAHV